VTSLPLRFTVLALIAASAVLSSCGSSPAVKFYTLSPQAIAGTASSNLAIKIGPTDFPRALDRSQIVTRLSSTQQDVNQFNVWSAPLESQFLNVLGDNLGTALGTYKIVVYPNESAMPIDYQVLLDVVQFDGETDGSVTLRTRWVIASTDGSEVASGFFSQDQPTSGAGYDALVAAHSELIAALARSLASRFEQLSAANRPD
jgi:uncharacterized lipoprotein YmbA